MNLQDLLGLLREEFALDVPATREALARAAAAPETAAAELGDMLGFIERSMQVSGLVGLHGFGGYLQQVHEFSQAQMQAGDAASLQWLARWPDCALAYLDEPAAEHAVAGILDYLLACPQPTDEAALIALQALLSEAPALSVEDQASAQEVLEPATADDVSLSTEDVDAELLGAMLADAPEQLEKLHQALQRMGQGQASAEQMLEAQRIAHTFKGSGNIIGLPGIGRVSHRLEDLMEWALEQAQAGEPVPPAAVRDMGLAVDTLQHMVGYLQGEEAAPAHSQEVLQRLLDWVAQIRSGEPHRFDPPALSAEVAAPDAVTDDAPAAAVTAAAGAAGDGMSLRVGVDRLSRVLRRAGQSIVNSQRMGQLMRVAQERLQQLEVLHQSLEQRLRELEATVDRQVVQLREQKEGGEGFDPLEMDRYDALHGISRFVTEAVQDELELAREARRQASKALTVMQAEQVALRDQHRDLLDARLVPVKSILPRLRRNVAQTASTTGKQARLLVEGENVTLDADVLTRLTEPLLHLLRNAVDHGLEDTAERELLGKPSEGLVRLSFKRVGQHVEVVCADDGRGLDLPTIYDKAVEYGLIERGTDLSEDEIRRLILRSGFSTKGQVTEVSGRGVGMDVVSDRVLGLKGRLDIASEPFAGTTFTLQVPVSSGAAQALVVRCAEQNIALASDQVLMALAADQGHVQGKQFVYQDQHYPVYSLAVWLGYEEPHDLSAQPKPAVLAYGAHGVVALLVDQVVDARELILQEIGRLTRRIAGVVAGALQDDGTPLFLLDVPGLERAALSTVRIGASASLRKRLAVQRTRVLVVDDALSVRRSMQQLLEDAGYEVATANDGFEALEQMRRQQPAVMLTDLEMPNLNGLELTRRVREIPQWMALPVVMITSRATDKHRDMATQAGVDLYLTKPYTDAELLGHVRRLTAQDASVLLQA
jgi:chemotaxis protein histidine kinase CheA/ActR/RegA family two-component response regulator